jgi:hypothetical protein
MSRGWLLVFSAVESVDKRLEHRVRTVTRYKTQARDTSPETERLLIQRYRAMSPAEKVGIVRELSRASQALALTGLRRRHPSADDHELRMRLASTRLPDSVMREVFGWPPGR